MTVRRAPALVALGLLAAVPLTGDYAALIGSLAVVYALVALGFVVLTGWAGDVSLGQIVPFGLGAYATFALADRLDLPVALAMVLSVVVTLPIVIAIGLPALRLRGLDLAVGTLALALVFQLAIFKDIGRWLGPKTASLTEFSSSVVRVGRPHLGPISLEGNKAFYLGALLAAAAVTLLVAALGRSRRGLALRGGARRSGARRGTWHSRGPVSPGGVRGRGRSGRLRGRHRRLAAPGGHSGDVHHLRVPQLPGAGGDRRHHRRTGRGARRRVRRGDG